MSCRQKAMPPSVMLKMEAARTASMVLHGTGAPPDTFIELAAAALDFITADTVDLSRFDEGESAPDEHEAAGVEARKRVLDMPVPVPALRDMGYKVIGQLAQLTMRIDNNLRDNAKIILAGYGLRLGMTTDQIVHWLRTGRAPDHGEATG